MKTLGRLEKSFGTWFLIVSSFIFFILRLPSLFEPYWYGDEGIYQTLGLGIDNGRLLYRDIFDNKPPLLYLLYSFFNSDQFMVRLVNLGVGILSVIAFFFLVKKFFKNKLSVYLSTGFFAFILAIPLIEGNIANAENFMHLPLILAGYLIFSAAQKMNYKTLLASGLLIGVAFLFKIVAIFDFAAFFVFLLFADLNFKLSKLITKRHLILLLDKTFLFTLAFIIPIFITAVFFYISGGFSYFLKATFFSNVGYVGYGNKFIIPQGLLILKLLILTLFSLFVFVKRKSLGMEGVFIFLWIGFSLFNAFFSQRPYTHYLLVLLPSFSLLIGFIFANRRWKSFSIVLLLIILYLLFKNFWFYNKIVPYYNNFLSFTNSKKSLTAYQKFFDKRTPIDYQITDYLGPKLKKEDNIFIWGNNAQVYKLLEKLPPGRYTAAYHILNYKDGAENTIKGLVKNKPKFIILMPNVKPYPFPLSEYKQSIMLYDVNIYERIF
jgi:hypothetical protein